MQRTLRAISTVCSQLIAMGRDPSLRRASSTELAVGHANLFAFNVDAVLDGQEITWDLDHGVVTCRQRDHEGMGWWAKHLAKVQAQTQRAQYLMSLPHLDREEVELVPLPSCPALLALFERYPFMQLNWSRLDEPSRAQYDKWVASSWTRGQARRRARRVAKRVYYGRAWTSSRRLRWWQGVCDAYTAPNTFEAWNP